MRPKTLPTAVLLQRWSAFLLLRPFQALAHPPVGGPCGYTVTCYDECFQSSISDGANKRERRTSDGERDLQKMATHTRLMMTHVFVTCSVPPGIRQLGLEELNIHEFTETER